jgi:hypothetical protein
VEWKDDSSYIKLGKIVLGLSLTNDAPERTVKLGTDYTGVITKDNDRRQDVIQGVELTSMGGRHEVSRVSMDTSNSRTSMQIRTQTCVHAVLCLKISAF